jgi:tRNA 5-methylaminomethyl-2-thiouridine biosynthesis bifunctional protein
VKTALIIGAGLASAALGFELAHRGIAVTVIDGAQALPHPSAPAASTTPVALMAPLVAKQETTATRLTELGIACTTAHAQQLLVHGQDWLPTGALKLHTRHGPSAQWQDTAAWVKPAALVAAWLGAQGITLLSANVATITQFADPENAQIIKKFNDGLGVQFQRGAQNGFTGKWAALDESGQAIASADCLILANAHGAIELVAPYKRLTVDAVAGQVLWGPWDATWQDAFSLHLAEHPSASQRVFPLNGSGHFIPNVPTPNGPIWLSGSTYEHGLSIATCTEDGIAANTERLAALLPSAASLIAFQAHAGTLRAWAGMRCTTYDRMPIVGAVDVARAPGLHICTAMGSRGLSFAAICAQALVADLLHLPCPIAADLRAAMDVSRFA